MFINGTIKLKGIPYQIIVLMSSNTNGKRNEMNFAYFLTNFLNVILIFYTSLQQEK